MCISIFYLSREPLYSSLWLFFLTVCRKVVRSAEEGSWGFVPAGQHLCWIHCWRRRLHGGLFQGQSHSFWVSICRLIETSKHLFNNCLNVICLKNWSFHSCLQMWNFFSTWLPGSGLCVLTWLPSTQCPTPAAPATGASAAEAAAPAPVIYDRRK